MEWKTDTTPDEVEEEPYTSFKNQKSGPKLIEKSEMPMILIGAGLFLLIILFVVFIPKKDKVNVDDFKALVAQVSSLEQKLEAMERKNAMTIMDYQSSTDPENPGNPDAPVDAHQMITWIKSNAVAIAEIVQKVDALDGKTRSVDMSTITAPQQPAPIMSPVVPPPGPAVQTPAEPAPKVAAKPAAPLQPKAVSQPKSRRTLQAKAQPPAKTTVTPTSGRKLHTVAKGETLYRIAKQYGISIERLQQLNGMQKGDLTIQAGRKLVVGP